MVLRLWHLLLHFVLQICISCWIQVHTEEWSFRMHQFGDLFFSYFEVRTLGKKYKILSNFAFKFRWPTFLQERDWMWMSMLEGHIDFLMRRHWKLVQWHHCQNLLSQVTLPFRRKTGKFFYSGQISDKLCWNRRVSFLVGCVVQSDKVLWKAGFGLNLLHCN